MLVLHEGARTIVDVGMVGRDGIEMAIQYGVHDIQHISFMDDRLVEMARADRSPSVRLYTAAAAADILARHRGAQESGESRAHSRSNSHRSRRIAVRERRS